MQSMQTVQKQGHFVKDSSIRWRLCVLYVGKVYMYILWYCCMYFFFFLFRAFWPRVWETSPVAWWERPKRFICKSCMHFVSCPVKFVQTVVSQPGTPQTLVLKNSQPSQTRACLFFFCKMKHSSPFTDAAGKSVSPLSQKTIWKPTSSLFIQEGILRWFEFTMNFMDQGERKMLQAKTSIIRNGSVLNPNLLFASFCTVICFGFGLIISLDSICFQKMMKDKRQLLHSYFRTSLNYYGPLKKQKKQTKNWWW